jgi:hypothetical protein
MRYFAWLLKPPGWLLAVGALVGAGVFIVVSFFASPFLTANQPHDEFFPPVMLAAALALLLPAARGFGVGFYASLLIATVAGPFDRGLWWRPIGAMARHATRPMRDRRTARDSTAAWLARHRGRPLEIRGALTLLSNLGDGCLLPLRSDAHGLGVPPDLDGLLNYPRCERFRVTTMRVRAEWPKRYETGDDGWRWTFERLAGSTAAGGPNFRVELRPDSILQHPGPIVEENGDGRVRVRDRDDAPWHVVDTPIPTMRRVRECVLLAAAMAAGEGNTTALFEYLWEGHYANRVCSEIRISSATTRDNGDHVLDVKPFVRFDVPRPPTRVVLFRMVGEKRFEIRGRAWGQRYLLDADGLLHVTTADRDAGVSDPAPEGCEEDTAVACGG